MKTVFVTAASDRLGMAAISELEKLRQQTRLLAQGEGAASGEVALFTPPDASGQFRNRFLSVCPHKFAQRGVQVPAWAKPTPFQVAIRPDAQISSWRMRNFKEALGQVADTYTAWNPWTQPAAPWNPRWHQDVPPEFTQWQREARKLVHAPSMDELLPRHLTPVFRPSPTVDTPTLVVIGCAAFNRPHTDVVDRLLPHKMRGVVEELSNLVGSGNFTKVEVVVARGDIVKNAVSRSHLHPFIFMAVAEVERMLGKAFTEPTRLGGKVHARSDQEIGKAFDASAEAMERQLALPLGQKTSITVEVTSWMDMIGPYLQEAAVLAESNQHLLEAIYTERVRTRPSYAVLHALDPAVGLQRTMGNAALYIAEALYLREHPECVVANCEVFDTYWKGLAPILRPLWGTRVPYIGMLQEVFRQPWGY